ncbi:MAG TPA: sulfotransferase [Myxococcota bacterium]|nr:sulfotransferase [Myxococcota bacterium]
MLKRLEHPQWVRRLNLFGPSVGDPRHVVGLDADELTLLARRTTGLDDFGDAGWEPAYRALMSALDGEAKLHLLGRLLTRAELLRVLQTKLRLQRAWSERPAMLREPIAAPIFVLGPPRSGTTILLELLALDSNLRAPIAWEAAHPLPLLADPALDVAHRMELAESEHELWAEIDPDFLTMHELRHDLPCECVHFTQVDFAGPYWSMQYDAPSHLQWKLTTPGLDARFYQGHRRFLQTLQHGGPPRKWLLKSPAHLSTLPALFAEYPDARVIHTHRDPTKFVASVANLMCTLRYMRSDRVDVAQQGQIAFGTFKYLLDLGIQLRKSGALPEQQIVDSHYLSLMSDPVANLRSIYERIGLAWPGGHDERIRSYLRDKPKAKFGAHTYKYEELGLSFDAVREQFSPYVAHYGIREES